jgi:hypothetical protein
LGGADHGYFFYHYNAGNRLYFRAAVAGDGSGIFGVGSNTGGIGVGVIETSTWQHYLTTYDNGQANLYKNGALIGNFAYSGPLVFATAFRVSSGGNEAVDSLVDDVRIYNRVLSESEMLAIYNATK